MEYCARCLYPANAKPTIIFDDAGICSGCRHHESRSSIDWTNRAKLLTDLFDLYRTQASERGQAYDCIVPVSGGKDSHYLVHLVKNVYGLNPLCVTFNHVFNTPVGIRNLRNLVKQFGVDHIRFTPSLESIRKIARYMVHKVGDITWHYHAGIYTFPFQIAVKYKIPLVVWPEHYGELTGVFTLEDLVEFTKWCRQEHDMRGLEPEDIVGDPTSGLTMKDLQAYRFPSDEDIEDVGVRGIYITNFLDWDDKKHSELMLDRYAFEGLTERRDRTFRLCAKTDDHANDVHDYMKYLKFGYGRATDDASTEIRYGRMTREEGMEMVRQYDHVRPSTLDQYLQFLQMTEQEFEQALASMRDPGIWERPSDGRWQTRDSVVTHQADARVDAARVPQLADRALSAANKRLYYIDGTTGANPAAPSRDDGFVVL